MTNNSNILKLKENVPDFMGVNRISNVFSSLVSIFTEQIAKKATKPIYIFGKEIQHRDLTPEEKVDVSSYISGQDSEFFTYLLQQKEIAYSSIKEVTIPVLEKLYNKKYFYTLRNLAIVSDNLPLFKYVLLGNLQKPSSFLTKPNIDIAINELKNTNYPPQMFVSFKNSHLSLRHSLQKDFAGSQSLACSESTVFIATKPNTIHVFHMPGCSHHLQPYEIHFDDQSQKPYSICYLTNYLFIFTSTDTFLYKISKNGFDHLSTKFKTNHPVCTDGTFFYMMDFTQLKLTVMQFIDNEIRILNTITLKFNGKFSDQEFTIPFACNGTFLSIYLPQMSQFYIFSLITGEMFDQPTIEIEKSHPPLSICVSKFSGRFSVLTISEVAIFDTPQNIPRSVLGFNKIKIEDQKGYYENIWLALFHGRNMFAGSDVKECLQLARHYLDLITQKNKSSNTSDISPQLGFQIVLQILCRQNLGNSREFQNFLNELYDLKNEGICSNKLLLTLFFQNLRNRNDGQKIPIPNVANSIFEKGNELNSIFIFYDYIDFHSFKLSRTSIKQILIWSINEIDNFPIQTETILSEFFSRYVTKHVKSKSFSEMFPILQAFMEKVKLKLINVLKGKTRPEFFYKSVHFRLWKQYLQITYQNLDNIIDSCFIYADMFNFWALKSLEDNQINRFILNLVNASTFILFSVVFNSPYARYEPVYNSIEEFFKDYDNPLNGLNPTIDTKLFEILNKAYDLESKEQFSKLFFSLRRYLIYEFPSGQSRLKTRLENKTYSVQAIEQLLYSGNPNGIVPISNKSNLIQCLIQDTVEGIQRSGIKKYNIEHEILFISFLPKIKERVHDFLLIDSKILEVFVKTFSFPFLLPYDITKRSNLNIETSAFKNIPIEYMIDDKNLKTKIKSYFPNITNPNELIQPLKNHEFNNKNIKDKNEEAKIYRTALMFLIGSEYIKENTFTDKNILKNYSELVLGGNKRIIIALMRALKYIRLPNPKEEANEIQNDTKELILELLDIIKCFTLGQNKFINYSDVELGEVEQNIFIIIDAFRDLYSYHHKSKFQEFLDDLIDKDPKNYGLVASMILNSSLDCLRQNARIKVILKTGEEIEGFVTKYDSQEDSFDIFIQATNKTRTFTSIDCLQIWCYPLTHLDLSKCNYSVYSKFFNDFVQNRQKYTLTVPSYYECFLSASFMELIKYEDFIKRINDNTKAYFSTKDFTSFVVEKLNVRNYFVNLQSTLQKPQANFMFTLSGDSAPNNINLNSHNGIDEGFIATEFYSEMLISTPIHPFLQQTIEFHIEGNANALTFQKPAATIRFCAYTNTADARFEINPIQIRLSSEEGNNVKLEIKPEECSLTFYIDGIEETKVYYPPSTSFFYFILDVARYTVIEYKYMLLSTRECYGEKEKFDPDKPIMRIVPQDYHVPTCESKIFNETLLNNFHMKVNNSLKELISTYLFSQNKKRKSGQISLSNYFKILVTIHQLPFNEETELNDLQLSTLWLDSQNYFFDFVKKNLPSNIDELMQYFDETLNDDNKTCLINQNINRSAVYVPLSQQISLQNCFVISPISKIPLKSLGIELRAFQSSSPSFVIPYHDITGTIFQLLIFIRIFLLTLKEILKRDNKTIQDVPNYISHILQTVQKVSQKESLMKPLYAHIIEYIQTYYPIIPNELDQVTYFLPQVLLKPSTINLNYFLPAFLVQYGEKQRFDGQYLRLPFTGKYLISIMKVTDDNTVEEPDKEYQIKFELDLQPKLVLKTNQYTVIDGKKPTIKAQSTMVDLSKYSAGYIQYPDLDLIKQELPKWTLRDSQQLLQIFPESFMPNEYIKTPLATKISTETAKFVHFLLKSIKTSNLASVNMHLTRHIQTTRENKQNSSQAKDSKSNETQSLLTCPKNKFAKDEEKIKYLLSTNQQLNTIIDERTENIISMPPQNIDMFKTHPEKLFSAPGASRVSISWFNKYLKSVNDYVFLLLVEFASGKFGLHFFTNGEKIAVRFIDEPNVITSYAPDMLLTIGKFENEQSFVDTFNRTLQQFDETK